jgi:hypothetical protein
MKINNKFQIDQVVWAVAEDGEYIITGKITSIEFARWDDKPIYNIGGGNGEFSTCPEGDIFKTKQEAIKIARKRRK